MALHLFLDEFGILVLVVGGQVRVVDDVHLAVFEFQSLFLRNFVDLAPISEQYGSADVRVGQGLSTQDGGFVCSLRKRNQVLVGGLVHLLLDLLQLTCARVALGLQLGTILR